ncbi:hypothetical protein ACVEWC_001304 [Enterobacter hormaechei]
MVYSAALTFIVALMRCFIMRKINEHTCICHCRE